MNHVTSFTHVSSSSSPSSLSSSPLLLILVPRMLLLLLVAQATAKTATEEIAAPCYFKVMTLNAFNFVDAPDWGERVHEIREMVIRNDPDCVAFEEVRIVEGNISMIDDLMNNLKDKYPSWKYGTASKFSTREEEGVAIACKWATHSVSTTTMKRLIYCSDPLTRVVVRMSVAVGKDVSSTSTNTNTNEGDTVVDVYATHWSYSKCNQEMNAERTLAFVNASSVGSSAFVLGDFNAYEESPPSLAMMEMIPVRLAGNDSAAYYMRDSWRALHPDVQAFPGYTFSSLKHKKGLHNRCDRIFYAGKATPVGAEVVCENPGRELIPSDHCAYLFTAEIPCPASTITDAIHVAAYLPPLNARTLALCTELIAVLLFAFVVKKKLTRRQKRGLMNHQHNFLQQRSL